MKTSTPKRKSCREAKAEGKLAAIIGRQCPYTSPRLRKPWLEGYEKQKELAEIRGQVRHANGESVDCAGG